MTVNIPSVNLPSVNPGSGGVWTGAGGSGTQTRILLYSPEPILAKGVELVLRQAEGFELLPVCSTLADLSAQVAMATPDIVLLDYTPEITFAFLAGLKGCSIVLWVGFISTEFAYQALGLGVRGILRKTLSADLQVKCLEEVRRGELWFEKPLTDSFLCSRRVTLTPREGQLVNLLSQGLKNKEIATELSITEGTVKVYLSRLFQKLQVKDRFELALFALKNLSSGQPIAGIDRRSTMAAQGPHSFVLPGLPARASAPAPSLLVR